MRPAHDSKHPPSTPSSDQSPFTRRTFVHALAASAAAVALSACGGGEEENQAQANPSPSPGGNGNSGNNPGNNTPPVANASPTWRAVPTITFTQGVPASISIAAYVSDADGDAIVITKNSAALPPGVTYDAASKSLVYDGVGAVGSTTGHVFTADDGRA